MAEVDEKVISLLDRIEAAKAGGELDSAAQESFDREVIELRATIEAGKASEEDAERAAEATAAEENAALVDSVMRSTNDRHAQNKASEKMKEQSIHLYDRITSAMAAGKTVGVTMLPAVVSAEPAPEGAGAIPRLHIDHSANSNAPDCEVHMFVRPELQISESKLDMFPTHQIGYVGDVKNSRTGARQQVTYSAIQGDVSAIVNATTTGGVGAGQFPQGTTFVPTPELPRSFTGPMSNPSLFNVKVTPGDINPMKVLQITAESAATHPAPENTSDTLNPTPSDPTTAEITIGAAKIATNLRFTNEVLMKNYIVGFEEVFGRQGLHQHLKEVDEALTTGTGAGGQAKGILTAADAIANIEGVTVAKAALASWAVDEVTYLELKSLIKPGVRGGRMVFLANDDIHFRAMIRQYRNSAPGYPLMVDMSQADDTNGILGRIFGGWVVSNQTFSNATNTGNSTVGLVLEGDSWCTRTTGTTLVFNYSVGQGRDQIEAYARTYTSGDFTWPQVAGEFSVGRLRTGA